MIPLLERVSFDRITDLIWLGSRISSMDDYHRLRAQGVRACVDMKHEGADPWTFETFLWLPTVDHDAPTRTHLHMGIGFLRQCERASMPVFVHCMAGIGRSATVVLAYMLAGPFKQAGHENALEYMCSKRACVNPNSKQLQAAIEAAETFIG